MVAGGELGLADCCQVFALSQHILARRVSRFANIQQQCQLNLRPPSFTSLAHVNGSSNAFRIETLLLTVSMCKLADEWRLIVRNMARVFSFRPSVYKSQRQCCESVMR